MLVPYRPASLPLPCSIVTRLFSAASSCPAPVKSSAGRPTTRYWLGTARAVIAAPVSAAPLTSRCPRRATTTRPSRELVLSFKPGMAPPSVVTAEGRVWTRGLFLGFRPYPTAQARNRLWPAEAPGRLPAELGVRGRGMGDYERSTAVQVPPARLFSYLADVESLPAYL